MLEAASALEAVRSRGRARPPTSASCTPRSRRAGTPDRDVKVPPNPGTWPFASAAAARRPCAPRSWWP
eukprot:470289-Alexandrium_andersonii.AAC.1